MKDDEVNKVDELENKILPAFEYIKGLKNSGEDQPKIQAAEVENIYQQYKNDYINNFMSAKNNYDVVECFTNDPEMFYSLFYDTIILFVYDGIKKLVSEEQSQSILRYGNTDMRAHINIQFGTENLKDKNIKEWYYLIKQTYLGSLIYITFQNANYYNFNEKLSTVSELVKQMKTTTPIKTDECHELIEFPKNITINTVVSNAAKVQQEIDTYFNLTKMSKLVNTIVEKGNYTMDTDLNLSNEYFKMISSKKLKIYNLKGSKVSAESEVLFEFLASKLDPDVRESYLARFAPDKDIDTILNKISRKKKDLSSIKIPYFYNLIKDPKRLSLVFATKSELYNFVKELRSDKMFGENFSKEMSFEDSQIYIRIKEIKNGFKEAKAGAYQDLKVIFEYYIADSNVAFQVECQCNLDTLIKWKTSEHVIYDFVRAKDDYETVIAKLKEYRWLESSNRATLLIFRNLILLATSIIFFALIISTGVEIYLDRFLINHFNDRINVGFVKGPANDVCLYGVGEKKYSCIGESQLESQMVNLLQYQIQNSYLYNDYYYYQEENQVILQTNHDDVKNSNQIREYRSKVIEVSENFIIGIDLQNQINIYDKQLNEKVNEYTILTLLECGTSHNCVQNTNGLYCWGFNSNGQLDIPAEFANGGANLLAAGSEHTCAQNKARLLCWGIEDYGVIDVPTEFALGGLDLLSAFGFNSCGQNSSSVLCWGLTDQGQAEVPAEFASGGLKILTAGYTHVCGQKYLGDTQSYLIYCWGSNADGESDVPYQASTSGNDLIACGLNFTCALVNYELVCWGKNSDGQLEIPDIGYDYTIGGVMIDLLSAGYLHACAQKQNGALYCWGSNADRQTDVPTDLEAGGLTILATGGNHNCALNETKKTCWGSNKLGQSLIPTLANGFYNFPGEFTIKGQLSSSVNDFVCYIIELVGGTDTDSILCYKISQQGYFKYYALYDLKVNEFCVYQYPDNINTAMIAYIDTRNPNKIFRQLLNEYISLEPIVVYENSVSDDGDYIKSLKCGSQHMCYMTQNGLVGCYDGGQASLEGELTEEMKTGVLDVYTGKFRTCVMKLGQIICNGIPFKKTTDTSFADII
eukprot:Mrub_00318.p1 GENE.Mrub_00318~~Mrub_00318.p1  ORF type:complete len:1191 (-),score=170.30 Mrub_00318:38-3313(-)